LAGFWGLVSGSALLLGTAVGYFTHIPQRLVAAIMAFGSGVLISALALELMEGAYHQGGLYSAGLGFVSEAALYTLTNWLLARYGARHRRHSGVQQARIESNAAVNDNGPALTVGALPDGIQESIVIGLSTLAGGGGGTVAVAAIFLSNLPEGLSSAAGMRRAGRWPAYVLGLWARSALVGYCVFRRFPVEVVAATTVISAGAVLAMIADTLIPEAFAVTHSFTGLITVIGFLVSFVPSKLGG
jgi:zinc transporter, ZIP family